MSEENGRTLCFFCTRFDNVAECSKCQRPYCPDHTSPLDTTLCSECVSLANTFAHSAPLIDEEGTEKKGRQILLSGEAWMRSRDLIANMTDIELEAKIRSYQEAVHEAELVLDYRRIMLGQAHHEKAERVGRSRARLRLIKAVDKTHHVAGATVKEKSENIKGAISALKGLGLNKEQMAQLLLKLSQKAK